jgi:hypothetical protein
VLAPPEPNEMVGRRTMYERTGRARINHQRRPPAHFNVSGHPFHSWYHVSTRIGDTTLASTKSTLGNTLTMRRGHQLPAADNKYRRNLCISSIFLGCDASKIHGHWRPNKENPPQKYTVCRSRINASSAQSSIGDDPRRVLNNGLQD